MKYLCRCNGTTSHARKLVTSCGGRGRRPQTVGREWAWNAHPVAVSPRFCAEFDIILHEEAPDCVVILCTASGTSLRTVFIDANVSYPLLPPLTPRRLDPAI